MSKINQEITFDEINKIAYASESLISKNLLDYLKPEYNKRLLNIEDRANEIVEAVRKSIKSDSPIENLLQEYELNTKLSENLINTFSNSSNSFSFAKIIKLSLSL